MNDDYSYSTARSSISNRSVSTITASVAASTSRDNNVGVNLASPSVRSQQQQSGTSPSPRTKLRSNSTYNTATNHNQPSQQHHQQHKTIVRRSCLAHSVVGTPIHCSLKRLRLNTTTNNNESINDGVGFEVGEGTNQHFGKDIRVVIHAVSPLLPPKCGGVTLPVSTHAHSPSTCISEKNSPANTYNFSQTNSMQQKFNDTNGDGYGGEMITLPLQYRDVCCPNTKLTFLIKNVADDVICGASLNLFDSNGLLRTGLIKLLLWEKNHENLGRLASFHGGEMQRNKYWWKPYHAPEEKVQEKVDKCREAVKVEVEDDWEWKAECVLHHLEAQQQQAAETTPSSSWLDELTKTRCREMLGAQTAENLLSAVNNVPKSSHPNPQDDESDFYCEETNHNLGSRTDNDVHAQQQPSYLILELPTFPIPIIFEEKDNTINQKYLYGPSGTITPLDLSHYRRATKTANHPNIRTTNYDHFMSNNGNKQQKDTCTANQDEFDLSMLSTLDYENYDYCNPAEEKYQILSNAMVKNKCRRSLVDSALKPNREESLRLTRIVANPSLYLTNDEKDLLWNFRFSLVDDRRALIKFLMSVDWSSTDEIIQTRELLDQWRLRSPMDSTDALKILGKHEAFQHSLVRQYAIDTLSSAPDEELQLYLLQLVQALKYEREQNDYLSSNITTTKRNTNNDNGTKQQNRSGSGSAKVNFIISSLAIFLISRASENMELANHLYWYLKVEMQDPKFKELYQKVFIAFKKKLSTSPDSASIQHEVDDDGDDFYSMWDALSAQDHFITGIAECQMESRDVRGKKDAKEIHLRDILASRGYQHVRDVPINCGVPLPCAPHVRVSGVNPSAVKMFRSALYPAVINFWVVPEKKERIMSSSVIDASSSDMNENSNSSKNNPSDTEKLLSNVDNHSTVYKVLLKTGDDLRQDQLIVMMVRLMDKILKHVGTLDLCLKSYSIMATSQTAGLLEYVENSMPISEILSQNNNSILQYFQKVAPKKMAKYGIRPDIMTTYIKSCAGYCVLTYLLGIGDRHLDNIMIMPSGHFFHIDFGFILGRDPKPLPPPFRLTKEMVDGMGGIESAEYRRFCSLACQAYNLLRKSADLVLNLLHLMVDAGINDLSYNPAGDAEVIIGKVADRFRLDLTDEQAESFFLGLIQETMSALAPRVMEVFHQLSVARR